MSGDLDFAIDKPVTPAADESGYYATIAVADHAIECLKDHAANHPDRPFFHYVAFIAPHFPLHALPPDIARYRDKYLAGWEAMRAARSGRQSEMGLTRTTLSALERDVGPPYAFPDAIKKLGPGEVNRPLPWSELTEEQRRFQATKMAIHAAMVDRMDQVIGRIIAHWPAGISARGELRHTPGHFIDIVPTVLELAAKMPDKVKELERVWQEQADRCIALARKTLSKQPQTKP